MASSGEDYAGEAKNNSNGNSSGLLAVFSYTIIFLAIGVPIWWKTTEIYRVSLPYDEIRAFSEQQMILPVKIIVSVCDESVTKAEARSAQDRLSNSSSQAESVSEAFRMSYTWQVTFCTEIEKKVIRESKNVMRADQSLQQLVDSIEVGTIKLYVVSSKIKPDPKQYFGSGRLAYTAMKTDLYSTCLQWLSLLNRDVVDPLNLKRVHDRFASHKKELPDKSSMRTIPSTSMIDVTFTLILPDPSLVDVHWDMRGALKNYLYPFAKSLEDIVQFNFNSQVLYLTMLDIKSTYDGKLKHHILNGNQLPHIINPVESKLGSHVSTNPALNFIVYVPPAHQTPLQMYDSNGQPSALNSFLIPRWGGFLFYNMDRSKMRNASIDMERSLGVFLAQLRSLLGLAHSSSDSLLLKAWEYDTLIRLRLIENLLTSTTNLQSLAQLLEKISNIVINDDIGMEIQHAVNKIDESYTRLAQGDLLAAFRCSQDSLIASEKAFFDPSLLELLYFPEDQKYAIYVPLFLPVSFPLITTLGSLALGKLREKKAAAKQPS